MPEKERRETLLSMCEFLTVTGANHADVVKALKEDGFRDFEDCLQDKCAATISADYIITRNVKDFERAEVRAVTPDEFREIINGKNPSE